MLSFNLILAFLRPALDFGSALGGLTGGITDFLGAGQIKNPDYYTAQGAPTADQDFMQALQAIAQATNRNTGMIDPVLLNSYSKMLGIDLSGLITAGGVAGDQYKQLATQAAGAGAQMGQAGNQILTQAFDPQNALHDYQKGVALDDTRAADSARGLAMSPYSVGNESDAMSKFEMDWQNRQLGRQISGAQGASGAYNASLGYGAAAPQATMAGAQAPIQGQVAAYSGPMDFSQQFLGAENAMFAPQTGVANLALPYLNSATNAAGNQVQQQNRATMQKYGMIGQGFESLFGGTGSGSGMGDPSQWFGFTGGNPFSMSSWGGGGATTMNPGSFDDFSGMWGGMSPGMASALPAAIPAI